MNTITKEQARERWKGHTLLNSYDQVRVVDILFPPFIPKEGEVIAVRNGGGYWEYREFVEMSGNIFTCRTPVDSKYGWDQARPLTDKEKGL